MVYLGKTYITCNGIPRAWYVLVQPNYIELTLTNKTTL